MSVTVSFDPTVGSIQAQIIPDATPSGDGVMTAAQAAALAGSTADITTLESEVAVLNSEVTVLQNGGVLLVFSNATRPTPAAALAAAPGATVVQGWNTSDKAPQWTDGLNWYDANGNLT